MTSAGVATVAFVLLALALYGLWTWRAWYEFRRGVAHFDVSLILWVMVHAVATILAVVILFGWLGSVAEWW